MSSETTWPRIAVVGAGAVGSYFGGMLARAGAPVMMIGRAAFVQAVRKSGLLLDTVQFRETVRPEASAEIAAARGADVVLFSVKTTDTAAASRELAKHISPHAIAMPAERRQQCGRDSQSFRDRCAASRGLRCCRDACAGRAKASGPW